MNRIIYLLKNPVIFIGKILSYFPNFKFLRETSDYQFQANFKFWFIQKVLNIGGNKNAYWPVHWTSVVHNPERILIGIDSYPGAERGCYITGRGGLKIGNYTQIASNVVIVTSNHDLYDSRIANEKPIIIGNYCWLGAGCKIMPGVILGDFTIVGAGAVVTKSFVEGYCVVGGVPAKKIKELKKEKCIHFQNKRSYFGYIEAEKFETYRKRYLNI